MQSLLVFLFVVAVAATRMDDATMKKCLTESGITEAELKAFDESSAKKTAPPEMTRPMACYMACACTETGMMSADGTLTALSSAGPYQKPLQECFNTVTATDRCDRGGMAGKCLVEVYSH